MIMKIFTVLSILIVIGVIALTLSLIFRDEDESD